ncbi:hypothetical protein DLJ53_18135 [Acuticoccus sediminis]|uniref:Uncharacterized protein n=1 Tax=Acuticoccus sediminis TaxID=2184697 RepID=A0A8B2NN72_9HYPH|nr:hypothetical protein [Acuticoccus sediminis]RAI01136.1 hypothetical protein DLJ53_18135 [Acuticoccus sediminis]
MAATNRISPEMITGFLTRFENVDAEFASDHGALMKKKRDDMKVLFDEAKGAGVPKKVMQAAIKRRKKLREFDEVGEAFDIDEQSQLEMVWDAAVEGSDEDWMKLGHEASGTSSSDGGDWKQHEAVVADVAEKGGDAVIVNKGGRVAKNAAKDKAKKPRNSTTTEDRIAKRAKAVGLAPANEGQTDIEDAAKAATDRDFAEADAETERFMDTSTNDRAAATVD